PVQGQVLQVAVGGDHRQGARDLVDLAALDADPPVLQHVDPPEAGLAPHPVERGPPPRLCPTMPPRPKPASPPSRLSAATTPARPASSPSRVAGTPARKPTTTSRGPPGVPGATRHS